MLQLGHDSSYHLRFFGVITTDALGLLLARLDIDDPGKARTIRDTIRANNSGFISHDESNRLVAECLDVSIPELKELIDGREIKDVRVLELIRSLRPSYKTALLSNIALPSLKRRMTDSELDELFDAIVVSSEVGHVKPEPEIYQYALDKLGLSPQECIFIDDTGIHCESAQAIGIHAIHFLSYEQTTAELQTLLADSKE